MRKICLFLLISLVCSTLYAQTYKFGEIINTNTTWLLKNSPFILDGKVVVDTNVTLTIEPGSTVILDNLNSRFDVKGTLISNGVSFQTRFDRKEIHKDSVYFNGIYYSSADYVKVKAAYDKVNYSTWFMPGLSYAYYQPKAMDSLGSFSGLSVDYLIFTSENQNESHGPSHVRIYGKLNILNSDKSAVSPMFSYMLGVNMSVEKNPNRSFLIPSFGLEFGGLTNKNLGSTALFVPTFGLYLLSKKNLYINVNGGYYYPISNLELLRGWYAQAGVNFTLW
jgi:hypothetical protein